MPYIPGTQQNTGLYVPLSNVWDNTRIQNVDVNSTDFKQLIVSLYQNINNIAIALNKKDSAIYDQTMFLTGAQWFNPDVNKPNNKRQEYRKVINFGALGVATKSVAHGIDWGNGATTTLQIVDLWAVATKQTVAFSALKIPYADITAVANNVQIDIDATNVTISNGVDRSMYGVCTVVIEWLTF